MSVLSVDTPQPRSATTADVEKARHNEKNIASSNESGRPSAVHESTGSDSPRKHIGLIKNLLRKVVQKSHENPLVDETPPDGGFRAWLVVFLAHQTGFNTFGFVNAYGVLQNHYVTTLDLAPSTVSWIGSLCAFLMLCMLQTRLAPVLLPFSNLLLACSSNVY